VIQCASSPTADKPSDPDCVLRAPSADGNSRTRVIILDDALAILKEHEESEQSQLVG